VARVFLKKRPKLKRKLDQLARIADIVHEAQRARHLNVRSACTPASCPRSSWASGEDDWSGWWRLLRRHEGDLIRAMRRLIDLLRQLGDAEEVDAGRRLLVQAPA